MFVLSRTNQGILLVINISDLCVVAELRCQAIPESVKCAKLPFSVLHHVS